ncbi:MAG: ThiF family adenylyltransferase [Pseudobdellovibrio sp.]
MILKCPERFVRCIGIMDEKDLSKIQNTSIAIGGLGLGGAIFINLVRMGFEKFHISDPDTYDRTNINRQRLAKESTIGVRKDEALLKEALDLNPNVQVKLFPEGINRENVSEFLEGIDWVVDVVDVFALNEKLALNNEAYRRGLPVASCGSLGFSSAVIIFDQNTLSFAELTGMNPEFDYETNMTRFLQFLCPEIPGYMQEQMQKAMTRSSHIPFVVPGVEFAAACATTEISKHILNLGNKICAPTGIFIDPVNLRIEKFEASYLARDFSYLKQAGKKAA